jgi:internalin A
MTPLINLMKADAEGPKRMASFMRDYLAGNPLSEANRSSQLDALKASGVRIEGK